MYFLQIGKFRVPTVFTAAPSINVLIVSRVIILLLFSDILIEGAPRGSTPIIFVVGDLFLIY